MNPMQSCVYFNLRGHVLILGRLISKELRNGHDLS